MQKYDNDSLNLSGYTIDQLKLGQRVSISKTITDVDIYNFAGLSGDFNPIHIDDEFAKKTRFGRRIAHGLLTSSFISTILGMKLPGARALYLSQTLNFVRPVYSGDTITAEAIIKEIKPEKKIFIADTIIKNQDGKEVVIGEAVMMADIE